MGEQIGRLDLVKGKLDLLGGLGSLGLSLGREALAGLLGLDLLEVVLLDPLEESQSRIGVSDVLDPHVDFLGDFPLLDLLLDDNPDRSRVDIEDLSGPAVVEVVRHALVDGSVDDDVHVVAQSVLLQVVAHPNGAVSSEALRELMPGS